MSDWEELDEQETIPIPAQAKNQWDDEDKEKDEVKDSWDASSSEDEAKKS